MDIKTNLQNFQIKLQNTKAKLIAVSKTHPTELIQEAYNAGWRVFGENRVQELVPKYEALPKDIEWHLIGTLQSNKVKYVASFVKLIHSVDKLDLLKEINKQALKNQRVIDCLLQIYIAQEETKHGFSYEEAEAILKSEELKKLQNIKLLGVMGMATFTDNQAQIRQEFKGLKDFFERMKSEIQQENVDFQEVSMGMSSDYELAIAEGSTMIRVGSAIFGNRS